MKFWKNVFYTHKRHKSLQLYWPWMWQQQSLLHIHIHLSNGFAGKAFVFSFYPCKRVCPSCTSLAFWVKLANPNPDRLSLFSQQTFWFVIAGRAQIEQITLTMTVFSNYYTAVQFHLCIISQNVCLKYSVFNFRFTPYLRPWPHT